MCLEERNFGSCSAWGMGVEMVHLRGKGTWGGLGVEGNYVNYKMSFTIKDSFQRFYQHFVCTSH